MIYLAVVLATGLIIILWFYKRKEMTDIILRKLFHFLAFIMFSVGIYYTPKLMKMAFSGIIWIFWVVEIVR